MPNPATARYVVLYSPPRGREWVELVGEPGELPLDVAMRAERQLRAMLAAHDGNHEHYCSARTLSYSAAQRAYPRELAYYEACREQEARRLAAGAAEQ